MKLNKTLRLLYKIILIFVALICIIFIYNALKPMKTPAYPLNINIVDEKLKKYNYDCVIKEDELLKTKVEEQSFYNMYSSQNGEFAFSVSSGEKDGERVLSILFPPFYSANAISSDEYKNAIAFATELFGGFKNESQVYNAFMQEYAKSNTTSLEHTASQFQPETESTWQKDINGITCKIISQEPAKDSPEKYLTYIVFASNWDTFFS